MPRKADALLEGRILDAAYHIWSRRGEPALTMRAVAGASGTTTPTLYERFSNKEDWATAFARKEEMPSFEFLKRSLAARLGGKPDRHTPLALALVAVLHGTATLLHSVNIHQKISRDFRCACIRACDALIRAASAIPSHSKRLP